MDGSTLGAAIALIKKNKPTDEQIESAVDNWLDDHPEATTTVRDGSITKAKLDSNLQGTVDEVDDLKDIVAIQSTQPTYSDNKIWIDTTNTPTGIEVPTYTELTDLMNEVNVLNDAVLSEIIESTDKDFATTAGTAVSTSSTEIQTSISNGDTYYITVSGDATVLPNGYNFYVNGSYKSGLRVVNTEYEYTADSNVSSVAVYVAGTNVAKTGNLKFTIYTKELNRDSIETRLETVETNVETVGNIADKNSKKILSVAYNNSDTGVALFSAFALFKHGDLSEGEYSSTKKYRVVSVEKISFKHDISISIASGFQIWVDTYVNGQYDSYSGWKTSSYVIPANTVFQFVIARATENTSEIADIDEFISKVTFDTEIKKDITRNQSEINKISEKTRNINTVGSGRFYLNDGSIDTSTNTRFGLADFVECEASTKYTASATGITPAEVHWYLFFFNASMEQVGTKTVYNATKATETSPATAKYMYVYIYHSGDGIAITANSDIQIEKGETATKYIKPETATDYIAREKADEALTNIPAINSKIESEKKQLLLETYCKKPYVHHIGITKTSNIIIPAQSLFDIERARRLGFDKIELNVLVTSDGKFIANHGFSGAFGALCYSTDGTDISETLVSTMTLDYIKTYVRYNSIYEKYRVAPSTLEEALYKCKELNLIPLIQYKSGVVEIADKIMGKNNYILGLYSLDRGNKTDAVCTGWLTIADPDDLVAKCDASGGAYVALLDNLNSAYDNFDNDDWKALAEAVHEAGYNIGSAYITPIRLQTLRKAGFDMLVSQIFIPSIATGNIMNLLNDSTFAGLDTTGTISNNQISLSNNDTIKPSGTFGNVFLGGGELKIRFSGKIQILLGALINISYTFESDGTDDVWVSTFFEEESPTFTVKSIGNTTVYDLTYKASEM